MYSNNFKYGLIGNKKAYFSKLYKFVEEDLISKGFDTLTLGVEPSEVRNIKIYFNWGFTKYIKTGYESYLNGENILFNYYEKKLNDSFIKFNSLIPELSVSNTDLSRKFCEDIEFKCMYERKENKFCFLKLDNNQLMIEEINNN